jgi:hypothetical protein
MRRIAERVLAVDDQVVISAIDILLAAALAACLSVLCLRFLLG